jgi:hypothetical protein
VPDWGHRPRLCSNEVAQMCMFASLVDAKVVVSWLCSVRRCSRRIVPQYLDAHITLSKAHNEEQGAVAGTSAVTRRGRARRAVDLPTVGGRRP